MTPVEQRNFVSVVPAANKKQARPVFFSKYPCHVHKEGPEAKNRTKNGQKPSKKGVFTGPSGQLAEFGTKRAGSISLDPNEPACLDLKSK